MSENKKRFRIRWNDVLVALLVSASFAWFLVYAVDRLTS